MRSDATRSTPPSSTFTPPNQRGRYSQPNLPTLLVSYNDGRSASGSPDRRIRMSQPTLNSSFSGINFVGINKGRLSYPSLRASGDNYINFKIDEERLSAPNVHSAGLPSQPDVTHVLKRDPPHKRERLSQPTLVPGDYYPGRGHQRLSQPCLSSGKDLQTAILSSPIKHKRFSAAPKVPQRDRLYQLDFGASRIRHVKDLQPVDLAKFNRDRFSIPELETANDLKLIAGTPKQRFSLDSSLNEPKRRSRLLPIASSPISENLAKVDLQTSDGKKAADGLESVLITSTSPLLPTVESVFDPLPPIPNPVKVQASHSQRMSVPDISTSSLRRLLDPPAKQRHSITGNLRQCLLPAIKKVKKSGKTKPEDDSVLVDLMDDRDRKEPPKNVQRHYSYTYETSNDSSSMVKENMSIVPRKKFLESNFDRNEQVITTVIESEVPMILTSPKSLNKAMVYGSETPKWMRKYLDLDNESPKIGRRNSQSSRRKAWQNSNRDSVDSVDSDKEITSEKKDPPLRSSHANVNNTTASKGQQHALRNQNKIKNFPEENKPLLKDSRVVIESRNSDNNKYKVSADTSWLETDICRLYGLDCEDTESDESTSI